MATTTYPNKLIAGSNLGLADANDIVYSTREVSAGDGETVAIKDKSVLDKLNEIEQSIENIGDIDTTDLQTYVTQAESARTVASQQALAAANSATQAAESVAEVNTIKDRLNNVEDIARTFSTGFDAANEMAIVSEAEYELAKANNQLTPNCIYFCYDNSVGS